MTYAVQTKPIHEKECQKMEIFSSKCIRRMNDKLWWQREQKPDKKNTLHEIQTTHHGNMDTKISHIAYTTTNNT